MQKHILISIPLHEFQDLIREVVRAEIQAQNKEPPKVTEEKYYSRREVAKLLSISLGSLNKYVKNGSIPAKRLNGRVLILKSSLESSLKNIKAIKHSRNKEY